MTLGQNIQAARKAKNISQEALAEKIGVSRQALGKWEKDTALPGLDNLQALARELGVSVDALLGHAPADTAGAPAVTLDAMRDLLAARDAHAAKQRRLWGCLAAAVIILLAAVCAGTVSSLLGQIRGLSSQYTYLNNQLSQTTGSLSSQISELQDAVRQGESTVLDWGWYPLSRLENDISGSWMPIAVYVTPRSEQPGMTATLCMRSGDESILYDMQRGMDGVFTSQGQVILKIGAAYDLSVQWTAPDGTLTNETLDQLYFSQDSAAPMISLVQPDTGNLTYSLHRSGSKSRFTLCYYPLQVSIAAYGWMQPAKVEVDLRQGNAGEPLATAELTCEEGPLYSYGSGDELWSDWSGTFYDADTVDNGWPYTEGEDVKYVVRVTSALGNVWEQEFLLLPR